MHSEIQLTKFPFLKSLLYSTISTLVFLKWGTVAHSEHSPVSEAKVTGTICIFLGKTDDLGSGSVINGKMLYLPGGSGTTLWWADIKSELLNTKYDLPTGILCLLREFNKFNK